MSYQGSPNFSHAQTDKIGVLLTNLGTPDAPTPTALRRYLKQFLSDPRVVEVPRLFWWLILNGIILQIRPRKSAKAYAAIWTEDGSPLLVNTKKQTLAIAEALAVQGHTEVVVEFAMRYGQPGIADTLSKMFSQGVRKLLVLPLYPQYSATTTGSTFDAVAAELSNCRWIPDLRFICHYHDYSGYIDAAAARIEEHWRNHGKPDKLLFSYHGVPQRYLQQGDPYFCECHKTSRLIATNLGLDGDQYLTVFQSRFGREQWLQPYIDETLIQLPAQGVNHVQVFCPGFAADCLETIEEIGEENREHFLSAGGGRYEYISALNERPEHIAALTSLIVEQLANWRLGEQKQRVALAKSLGAAQ